MVGEIVKEFFWAVFFLITAIILLPVVHLIDWSGLYLSLWTYTKITGFFSTEHQIRFFLLASIAASAFLFAVLFMVFIKQIPFKSSFRLLQWTFVFCAVTCLEFYLNWQGYFPGSVFRHFRIVGELKATPIQYADETGMIRYTKSSQYLPLGYSINEQGFRSKYSYDSRTIDSLRKSGKKIAMIIGDSFVAGLSAEPINNCFTDLLDGDSLAALNFGQLGADPAQYELVSKVYINKLRPDYVIVCVYENDFLKYQRVPHPHVPIYYQSNASPNGGMLLAQKPLELGFNPNDNFTNLQDAYQFYSKEYTIRYSEHITERLASYTALTTQLYLRFFDREKQHAVQSVEGSANDVSVQNILYKHLFRVKESCDVDSIPVYFLGVPSVRKPIDLKNLILHGGAGNIEIVYPADFTESDYQLSNGGIHFNNQGHAKYADFVSEFLKK